MKLPELLRNQHYKCDICDELMFEVRGHDFMLLVCPENDEHSLPRFYHVPWCNPHHWETIEWNDRLKEQIASKYILRALQTPDEHFTIEQLANDMGLPESTIERIVSDKKKWLHRT